MNKFHTLFSEIIIFGGFVLVLLGLFKLLPFNFSLSAGLALIILGIIQIINNLLIGKNKSIFISKNDERNIRIQKEALDNTNQFNDVFLIFITIYIGLLLKDEIGVILMIVIYLISKLIFIFSCVYFDKSNI